MIRPHYLLTCLITALISTEFIASNSRTTAQSIIVPDNTLGSEESQVIENFRGLPIEVISGGALREQNLFHSFTFFNVDENRGAYFFSPNESVENIISRVTGERFSLILGTLGTFGVSEPNLFLINPNGILFGPDAVLDVGASFAATTANAINLGPNAIFSASQPETSQLLNIDPSVFIFSQQNPAPIFNFAVENTPILGSFVNIDRTPSPQRLPGGLEAVDGKSIIFLGGDISFLNFGTASTSGGYIDVGSLSEPGTVGITEQDDRIRLAPLETQTRLGTIRIADVGLLDVTGRSGGSINLYAENILLENRGSIIADVFGNASGQGISIYANDSLIVNDGIISSSSLFSEAIGGDIRINANEIQIEGETLGIVSTVTLDAGNAGNTIITTNNLSIQNGGQILTSTFGSGDAGKIILDIKETVEITGTSRSGISSTLASNSRGGLGNAGDIVINTNTLEVSDEAEILTDVPRGGNGGDLTINALDSVEISSNGRLILKTGSNGNAGNLSINTQRLIIDDSEATTSTEDSGRAGNISINASESIQVGRGGLVSFSILASGDTGNITIQTPTLRLLRRGRISTAAIGSGVAGDIEIFASDSVEVGADASIDTEAITRSRSGKVAGDLLINTGRLLVQQGGRISTEASFGNGDGGVLTIIAEDSVTVTGAEDSTPSRISSRTRATGNAGQLRIETPKLTVQNDALISAGTTQQGTGNTILLTVEELNVLNGASISTVSEGSGIAGDIIIDSAREINLVDGNLLTEAPFSSGGDILINSLSESETGLLILSGDSDITTSSQGNGGNITIGGITIAFDDSDILARSQDASGGNIALGSFFSETVPPDSQAPFDKDNNVDLNADGQLSSGTITTLDTSFVQNSLSELPDNILNAETLISNSCIRQNQETGSSFLITGEGLEEQPDNISSLVYPNGDVNTIPEIYSESILQPNETIIEPTSIYQTADGRLVMSRECT
ncbi:filamentous hemagglutinin family N-terminal domain protein [Leptolyngbya sp. PCC 7375]|nr:filamentous hemagglutinin family N-terminal domain protein [Leptolyngbya sp. PCC 7375]